MSERRRIEVKTGDVRQLARDLVYSVGQGPDTSVVPCYVSAHDDASGRTAPPLFRGFPTTLAEVYMPMARIALMKAGALAGIEFVEVAD